MPMRILLVSWLILAGLAAAGTQPRVDLSADRFATWTGTDAGKLTNGECAGFRYPAGEKGVFKNGFRVEHDGTRDWRAYQGLEVEIASEANREVEIQITVHAPPGLGADEHHTGNARFRGSRRLYLSWESLGFPQARTSWQKFVLGVDLSAKYLDGDTGSIALKSVNLLMAPAVSLECAIRGSSAESGSMAEYEVKVGNPSHVAQTISLSFIDPGWQAMKPTIDPKELYLESGASQRCKVRVAIPENLPAGAHEKQVLQAIGNGDASRAQRLELITGVKVPPPYLLHTQERWQEVRDKVTKHAWAKTQEQRIVALAENWQVPEIAKPPANDPDDTWGPFLFEQTVRHELLACGIAWQLKRNPEHAEKVALFLRRLSDPESGYPATLRASQPSQVQEGQLFQSVAIAYDMIRDAELLDRKDCRQIDTTLRMFMATMERLADSGSINNWNVAESTGALFCALSMQDLAAAERWFRGPSGICEQLRIGTMDDGWWYECSVGYNIWVAHQFSQVAIAYQPWGVDFKNMTLAASLAENVLLKPELNGGRAPYTSDPKQLARPFGMDPNVLGPLRRPSRCIKDLWDSMIPFIDWRAVMFGVNDSTEKSVVAPLFGLDPNPFELAYFLYRDPDYASIIKRGKTRELLYGVPELPQDTPEPFLMSAVADNVGLAMLRSQTPDRPICEQIQAVMHYGTHGWAHGHFDRTGLLSLMRYGRSFYNPQAVWHGYDRFLYKFYVQTSVAKNMVVVDRKMQQVAPAERLLFHTGKMMQAAAVEIVAPWSHPPYGGMVYDNLPVIDFKEKAWREGRYIPTPTEEPGYGEMTGYTEPIRQRRVMAVMDDYLLLVDEVEGTSSHEFENLFQMKGFLELKALEKKFLGHDAQWDCDPLSGAQFVTDCDRYAVKAPALSRFEMHFGPAADNEGTRAEYSEDGILKLDVHTLWPAEHEIMFGTAPEYHRTGQRLVHELLGDGKILHQGTFGAWILGKEDVDVSLEGLSQLELKTRVDTKQNPSLFWGSARIVAADGSEIPLCELSPAFFNVKSVAQVNTDYAKGPVKIMGESHAFSTPAQPIHLGRSGIVRIDLTELNAVRFKATIGSDFPPGPEQQRRKTMAVKAPSANQARFLTLIEPYEKAAAVKSAVALSKSKIRVKLNDGRVQEITIHDLSGNLQLEVIEYEDGRETRRESTPLAQTTSPDPTESN